jgi:3-methyladenine DNA glycosylase AlkD
MTPGYGTTTASDCGWNRKKIRASAKGISVDTVDEVLAALEAKGSEQTRKTYARHGAPANLFGVKVADMKAIAKRIRGKQSLALELYATGNGDAQYLAAMVADGTRMTKRELETWAKKASWYMVSDYAVVWVATESAHARALALKWIKAKQEHVASSGWHTYAGILATSPDQQLDLAEIEQLMDQVEAQIHTAPNRVRYAMNNFLISVGAYVKPLLAKAKRAAQRIGKVDVDMGETACKVPLAVEYIAKVEKMGRVGKKRKTIRC